MRGSVILHITSQRVNKGVVSGEIIITAYIYGFLWTFQFSLFINRGHLPINLLTMRLKQFLFAFVAMLASFSVTAFAGDVIVVHNEAELRAALEGGGTQNVASQKQRFTLGTTLRTTTLAAESDANIIQFGEDITLTAPMQTNVGSNTVINLAGHYIKGAEIDGTSKHLYPFYNRGTMRIQDEVGGGYIDCGVYNGYDLEGDRYESAKLEMVSGRIVCHDDEGAAIINHGVAIISGGTVEGSVNALKNEAGNMTVTEGVNVTGGIVGDNVSISDGVNYTVAKIGDKSFASFSDALAAAKGTMGDVTVEILGEVEFINGMELKDGAFTSISFVGKGAKAKITINQTAGGDYLEAHGKTVYFTNLTLDKANPAWAGNSGHMGQYFSIQGGTVTYTNCTFLNGACTSGGTATYTGCTFQNAKEQYGLWVYDDALVTVNGGTIDSKKGIKVYSEDEASVTSTLTVKNATFTENVTEKPAVAIGYAESITLIGNTYNNAKGVLELDSGSDADCEGVTFVAQDENGTDISSKITATDRSNSDAACGVLVDGKIYTTVTEAAKETEAGDKVTVLYSTTEEVTFTKGVELVLAEGVIAEKVTVVPDYLYTYAEFNALIKQNGSYDGTAEGTLVVLKDSERSYQNNKTAQFFIGATNVNITDPVETVNVTGVTFEFVDDDETNAYTSGELQIFAKNIAFTNCTFKGTAVSPWGKSNSENAETATFTNCTWKDLSGRYGVHQNRASNLTVTGCTFENCERGIHTNSSTVAAITITDNTFTGIGDGYGAICLAENGNVGNATLNITGNKAEGQVFLRQLNANTTYAQVTEILNTEKNTYGTAYVSGSNEIQPPVAQIGTTTYTSLQAAIDAVKDGETITLLRDVAYDVTITQTADVDVTIDGNGKKFDGTIYLQGNSRHTGAETLTLKNINFVTAKDKLDFIQCDSGSDPIIRYPHNVTIENCNFTATTANNTVVAARFRQCYNMKIVGGTFNNLFSPMWATGGSNITVEDVKVPSSVEGLSFGTATNVSVINVELTAQKHGVRVDASQATSLTVSGSKIDAFIPVVVRYASADYNLTFAGDNTMEAKNTDGLWCAIGESEYKESGTMPTAATGRVKVTLNDTGLNAEGIYGNFVPTAKIGEAEYATLADAIAAVKNGETITLVAGIEEDVTVVQAPDVAFTIDGNDNTFKGTITVDGKSAAYATAGVTVKNIKFLADGITKDACINLGGSSNIRYTSNVTVDGCTFTGTAKDKVGVKSYTGGCKNVKIINSTATGMHSLAQLYPTAGVVIADNTITDSKNGVSVRSSSNVTISGVTMDVEGYGVRADANVATNATISDCNITAFIPVVVRNASADYNLTFAGNNTMTPENTDKLWCAIGTSEYEENGTMPTAATGKVKVTLNEEDTDLDIAGVYGNFGVASIGNVNYMTFAAALDAVKDGETIKLTGAAGEEKNGDKFVEIEFTKDIEFTITGEAPQYALPIVTFQNATVNIKNAEILIPELDARQDAVINVINSTVRDAGGNSIAKSYYNGAINIDETSTVYMMQVTTMGYINVEGKLNATWQTNVYGNGMITLSEGATFNTAALHLTAQDYNGRDNTDAGRVGKPATIVVDGADFTVGQVHSAGGADYSYNSSKGVNVGTIDGKNAILDIKNGANVNIFMANGETANFGAGATVNVEASTLKVLCRAADGVATLANAGTVSVSGASNLDIKNFSGNAIAVTDATLNDLQFGGRINAFGTNNISGTSKIGDILSLGYETNPTDQVVVNITGNFNGTNVIVYTNNGVDNTLKVGAADGERTIAHFGTLGGFADVNINNADVTYHYAYIRNDFNVTNSALEIKDGVNTYFAGNAKVVIDNSTWSLPGYANIGSYGSGYMYGNADVTLKNGSSMTATNLGVELEEGKEVKLTIEDNSKLTATNLSNQGSIVLANKEATITANSGVSNITTPIEDHKIGYVDGTYKVISKQYVAYIGEQGYESLAEALTAATDGATISLSWAEGNPAIAMVGTVCGNKTVTITGTANVDWSKGWFFVGRGGEGDGKVIFDNAKLTSVSNSTAYGINVSGHKKGSTDTNNGTVEFKNSTVVLDYLIQKNVMTLDNSTLTVKNGCSLTGRLANETENGEIATSTTTLNNGSVLIVNGQNGMNLGYEGYGVLNIDANSTFEATENYGVDANGTMNIAGTVKIAGTLTNNGTVYVTGASTLDAKVTGDGWFYMNGVTLDANTKLLGAKVAFINGENTVKGSTIKDGWFNVGIGQNAAAATAAAFAEANGITLGDVTVNVSDNATIYTSTDAAYSGWVGSAYSADKDAHKYILNITNSLARFGYMHVSKDGELNATGHSDNKYEYAGNSVDFYAGTFINNGNVTLNGVDAWAMYSKISVDHADAVLNIENGTKYMSNCTTGDVNANTFLYYKAGTVNVDETSSVNIEKATTFVDGAVLNIAGNVTAKGAITGNGAINFTAMSASLAAQEGLTINHAFEGGYKVERIDGVYRISHYVAKVNDVNYNTLDAALKALTDGATLTFLEDITVTEAWDERYTGGRISANNVTIDGNGKTVTFACDIQDGANYCAPFRIVGASATFKNLTIDMSQAANSKFNRLRAISSNATDLTVTNCKFIGSETITNSRAIIFGEGSQNIPETDINISECTFKNWRYGVTDNENGKDVGNVTVTGNIFENSSVQISASSKVVFDKNTLTDGGVIITSYTDVEGVSVQAVNNTLDADKDNKITTNPANHWISGEGFSTPVAKMGGKYYVSIQDAVGASTGSDVITLTVNKYLTLDEAVVIENKVVTLNLNGKTVRAAADAKMTGGIFRLLDGADFTITGEGEITNNGNANVIAAVGVLGAANLTVESGKLVGYYYGITGNGMKDGSTVTINGGEIVSIEGTGSGIYNPQNGTLNVTGGTISGATGIYFKSGKLNITGGTINGTGAKTDYNHSGNGSDATGDALVIENVAAGNYQAIESVSITGGTFNSTNAAPIASYAADGATALTEFVTGGTFNKKFSEECLPVGYQLISNDGGNTYGVAVTGMRESMTIVDGEYTEFSIETPIEVGTLTYKRTFSNVGGWNALYVPFEIPVEAFGEDYKVAYINDMRSHDGNENGVIETSEMTVEGIYIKNGTLRANHPYVIIPQNEEAKDLELVLNDVKVCTKDPITVDFSSAYQKFFVKGTYTKAGKAELNNGGDFFALTPNGTWAKAGDTAKLGAFRIFLTMENRDGSPVVVAEDAEIRTRIVGEKDEVTGIFTPYISVTTAKEGIFDLMGRPVVTPEKGKIYIIDGKKVLY